MRVAVRLALGALLLAGCSLVIGDLEPPEAAATDAGLHADVEVPTDRGRPDGAPPDAAILDAAPPPEDGRVPPPPDAGEPVDRAIVDRGPVVDAAPPAGCEEGALEEQACGLNGRGVRARLCDGGSWGPFGACVDTDECVDGSEDHAVCGFNDRGSRVSVCEAGRWGAFGQCFDPDECVDGTEESEPCGNPPGASRERACLDGRWTAWSMCGLCLPGVTEERGCGLNGRGVQVRTCLGFQMWSDWSACDDPDDCRNGTVETEACGFDPNEERSRTCEDGRWGPFSECAIPN